MPAAGSLTSRVKKLLEQTGSQVRAEVVVIDSKTGEIVKHVKVERPTHRVRIKV